MFSRDFTRVEMLLIVFLALVLVGLGYYQFVHKPVLAAIANADAESSQLRTELDIAEAELGRLKKLQNSMDDLEAQGELSWMSSYNNAKAEVAYLNDILADTLQYTISFSDIARSGNQIRRSFSLQYRTADYATAQRIAQKLYESENRCLISDVNCTIDAKDGSVTMRQTATFYETMVGGVADAGLPVDKEKTNK